MSIPTIIFKQGGLYDHPDRQIFKYRLRAYILGRNEGIISSAANVIADDKMDTSQPSLTGVMFNKVAVVPSENNEDKEYQEFESLEYDALENVAGYICHKLLEETAQLTERQGSDQTFSCVAHLSEVGLCKPSTEMMGHMAELHQIFNILNGDGLLITSRQSPPCAM